MRTSNVSTKTKRCSRGCINCPCKTKPKTAPSNGEATTPNNGEETQQTDNRASAREWDYVVMLSSGGVDHLHD